MNEPGQLIPLAPDPRGAGTGRFVPEPLRDPEYFDGVLWKRVFAYWVDLIVIALLWGVLWIPAGFIGVLSLGVLWPLMMFALALVPLLYHTALIGGAKSATLGMRLFGIGVLVRDGSRPDFVRAAVLTVLFYVSVVLTSWLVLLITLFNREKRTLHDLVCNTIIVNRSPGPAELHP